MPKKDKLYILDQIISSNVPKLILTGGEPLLDENILEIIKIARSNNIFTSIHTNGLLLNDNILEIIRTDIGRISLPLDGSSNAMNFVMRSERNYFNQIDDIIKSLKHKGISFSIKTVATRKNIDDIEKMVNIISDFNPIVWLITEFKSLKRGKIHEDEFLLHPGEFEKLRLNIRNNSLNISFFSNYDSTKYPHFFIDSRGYVFTNSIKNDYYVGDMFSNSISDLWKKIINKNKLNQNYFDHSRISL